MRDLSEHEIRTVSGGAAAFSPVPHDTGVGALVAPWTMPTVSPIVGGNVVLPVTSTLEDRTAGS